MEKSEKKSGSVKYIVVALLGALVAYFLVTFVANERLSDLQYETQLLISEQETLLATIAETTARNGADEVTESIIKDCSISERTRFDELLSSLNTGLNQSQLIELERLFGRCGNFYSERKSVMVARLVREIEVYEMFVRQLENITNENVAERYQVSEWQELAALETKQSNLFNELVSAQDKIITTLLSGNNADSDEIKSILSEVQEIQETLIVTSKQTSSVRSTLVSL